eukprot:m51a1_g93 hypothetical protein (470) ;mRNA; r:291361-292976
MGTRPAPGLPIAPVLGSDLYMLQYQRRQRQIEEEAANKLPARYWPGKAPEWADSDDTETAFSELSLGIAPSDLKEKQKPLSHPVEDERLKRLQKAATEGPEDREEAIRRRRERHVAEVLSTETEAAPAQAERVKQEPVPKPEEPEEPEEDDEEIERRRRAIREKLRKREQEEAAATVPVKAEVLEEPAAVKQEQQEESVDEEEYEDEEEEEEEEWVKPQFQPTFVTKEQRILDKERAAIEEEELKSIAADEERLRIRQEQSKLLVAQILKEGDEREKNDALDSGPEPPSTEIEDEAAEYALWRERELERIRFEKNEREQFQKDRLELAREEAKAAAESGEGASEDPKEHRKWQFMQKYYHRGAFFMDGGEWDISKAGKWDWDAATGEDAMVKKENLPKVLQVKNFGKHSRTKYTHLLDQDTTFQQEASWASSTSLQSKYTRKMGGMKDDLERPSKKKRTDSAPTSDKDK